MLDDKRALLTALVLGTSLVFTGCSQAPLNDETATDVGRVTVSEHSGIHAAPDAKITFDKSNILTVAAPPEIPVRTTPEAPVTAAPAVITPVPVTRVATPVLTQPAPVQAVLPVATVPAPVAQAVAPPAPQTRYVHVGLAGGQNVLDLGQGPVLFPLPAGFPPYVVEHDFAGGWARFGTLKAGMNVSLSGLVGGTYTVGQIITVPKFGHTDDLSAFNQTPKVMLQTCIPGTNSMIVVGLY